MVRYGLAKMLRDVKALRTRKKSANGIENLPLQGLASHSENFKVNIVVVIYKSSTYGRIKLIISLNFLRKLRGTIK